MRRLYGDKGWNYNGPGQQIGPRYLYVETGKDEGLACSEEGRYEDQVVSWVKAHGIPLEINAPYLPTPCDDNWTSAALGDAAVIKPVRAEPVSCSTDDGIKQIKTLLAQGRCCPMGTRLDDAFMNWTAGNQPWSFSGPAIGGHAICIVGYDDAKQAFKVRNSWGPEWGDHGYIWIKYGSLKNPAAGAQAFVIELEYSQALVNRLFGGGGNTFPPPTGVSASDGTSPTKVTITWNAVTGATGYKIYRDQQSNLIKTVTAVTSYNDTSGADGMSHTYWVKATKTGAESGFSASDTGYASGGGGSQKPVIYGVYFNQGNVGDTTQFYVDYYSADAVTFQWTLGGCNPSTSAAESPTATFTTAGTQMVTIKLTNSAGSTSVGGNFEIGGGGSAPVAELSANPTSGTAPLPVILDASGSTDDKGIAEFDWDWEGNGTFDYSSGPYSVISVYYPVGTWNTTVRVWDYDGKYSDHSVTITVTGGSQGSYTEVENNDLFSQSSAIHFATGDLGSLGSWTGYPGYDGDVDDVWGVNVLSPLTLQVQMDLNSSTGDLDLYLYDSLGNLGAWSETNSSQEYIQIALNPGLYYIVAHDYAGFSDYSLTYGSF
jgi:hypothetical protein